MTRELRAKRRCPVDPMMEPPGRFNRPRLPSTYGSNGTTSKRSRRGPAGTYLPARRSRITRCGCPAPRWCESRDTGRNRSPHLPHGRKVRPSGKEEPPRQREASQVARGTTVTRRVLDPVQSVVGQAQVRGVFERTPPGPSETSWFRAQCSRTRFSPANEIRRPRTSSSARISRRRIGTGCDRRIARTSSADPGGMPSMLRDQQVRPVP